MAMFNELSDKLTGFIKNQKIFFVATATIDSKINLSPKGMDTLKVLSQNRIAWLNLTGSGNETSAHVQKDGRMTLMFCAFEGSPLILRLYGKAKVVHQNDPEWHSLYKLFKPLPGARQIFELSIDLVHTSCGTGVPNFKYLGDRDQLNKWAMTKGNDGIKKYWVEKNQFSLDNDPTHIVRKNID